MTASPLIGVDCYYKHSDLGRLHGVLRRNPSLILMLGFELQGGASRRSDRLPLQGAGSQLLHAPKGAPFREVWRNEALDFTPEFEENTVVINEVRGLSPENTERERSAESLNVDIVAEDSGQIAAIKNQLERSDHLGETNYLPDRAGSKNRYLDCVPPARARKGCFLAE